MRLLHVGDYIDATTKTLFFSRQPRDNLETYYVILLENTKLLQMVYRITRKRRF
jgi:hypothetical protein